MEGWGDIAAVITLGVLVIREWRLGLRGTQERLVRLLEETVQAQGAKINRLEQELHTSRLRAVSLEEKVGVLEETVVRQEEEITGLQRQLRIGGKG